MKKILDILFIILAGSFLLTAPGCKSGKGHLAQSPSLKVLDIKEVRVPVYLQMVGQAEGIPTVEIRARVEGYLQNWSFREGSMVKKGQVLFLIEKSQYVNSVDYAKATLDNMEASWEYAKLNVARLKPLVATNAISQNDYDVAVTQEKQAKAAAESARANLDQARLNLSYTTMVSPIDGCIGKVNVRPGNLVGRGESTLLATVSAVDPIYVNFQMNETNYLGLARWIAEHEEELKSQNERPVQVLLTLSDKQPYPLPGTVDFIDRNIDPSTGAIALRAVFPNPKKLIKPGNFATVQLIVNEKDDAIIIPQGAIQQIQNKYFAFRVNDSNKVHRIPVTTGQHIGNKVLITDGLKAGDRILLEGFQKFQEGMKITPVPMTDSIQVSQHPYN